MNYTAWANAHLTHAHIGKSRKTSIWHTERSDLPLLVLVHGINGNHFGLVPLAVELFNTYQIVMIELPGHGRSQIVRLSNVQELQIWFNESLDEIEEEMGRTAIVCAHSFGCSAVLDKKMLETHEIILLNPVPAPSELYARYSQIILNSAHFWAHIYNWRFFIFLRGLVLAKIRTHDSMRRIRWTGWQSQPSYRQNVYQAGLVDVILDETAYQYTYTGSVRLVVCGMADTTAEQRDSLDMERIFSTSKTVFLSGGHLVPIESPDRVASVIREIMIH